MNQLSLFNNIEDSISIDDAAIQLSVSTASIRNWIKTGYLVQINRNLISKESFNRFKDEIAGSEKLISRANKSLKDDHNHDILKKNIRELLNANSKDIHDLGRMYEEALSNAYRNREGIYYTPDEIVETFFRYLPKDKRNLKFCDPCCGSGNFIIAAINAGFSPENVYGYDVDPIAAELTKKRVFKQTGIYTNNIIHTDFLEASIESNRPTYDVIFTNPPWGKKLDKKTKERYANIFGAGKSYDTTSLFFFAALSVLNSNGYIGFLVQDAFFNVASYEDVRKKALSLKIKALLDFGKPFKGLLTKAKGLVIENSSLVDGSAVECNGNGSKHQRVQDSFLKNPKSILNMNCSQEEANTIIHLYSLPHISLVNRAKWGLGIVTGNNKKFIIDRPAENFVAVYKGSDIKKSAIKAPSCFIPQDLSLYQQVAPNELYQAKEKLIYKFISSDLVFFCDTKQRYILNSANMIVLNKDFPISTVQLSQILNSKVINWLFKTIFDTHKVLRSDIEAIPIHVNYFEDNHLFDEYSFIEYLGLEETDSGTFRIKR